MITKKVITFWGKKTVTPSVTTLGDSDATVAQQFHGVRVTLLKVLLQHLSIVVPFILPHCSLHCTINSLQYN